jgi:hypothetical protein
MSPKISAKPLATMKSAPANVSDDDVEDGEHHRGRHNGRGEPPDQRG